MSDYLDPNNEELLKDFFAEAEQQVEQLESNILVIESDPNNHEAIDEIFRAAHTLKGGSATVEMTEITHFTHTVEDVLDEVRSDRVKVDESIVDILLSSIDVIKAMLEARQNGTVYAENTDDIVAKLKAYIPEKDEKGKPVAKAAPAPQAAPAPAPAPEPAPQAAEQAPAAGGGASGVVLPELTEDEYNELKQTCEGNQKLWCIAVRFDESNPMNSVGGIQVFAALKAVGNVLKTNPDFDALYEDQFYEWVYYYIATDQDGPAIEDAAFLSDVTLVTDAHQITDANYKGGSQSAPAAAASQPAPAAQTAPAPAQPASAAPAASAPEVSAPMSAAQNDLLNDILNDNVLKPEPKPAAPAAPAPAAAPKAEEKKAEAKPAAGAAHAAQQGSILRVDSRRIDNLLNLVSEAVITKASFNQLAAQTSNELNRFQALQSDYKEKLHTLFDHLTDYMERVKSGENPAEVKKEIVAEYGDLSSVFESYEAETKGITGRFRSTTQNLGTIASELQEGVMKIRMVPINQIFSRFPRVVRDLQRDLNKKIDLVIEGEDTELDKSVVEDLLDPIMHCVRNSVDHGIEMPDVRKAAGKPETGTVLLKASNEGNQIVIEIKDDGAGVDVEKVKAKAIEKGLIHPDKQITEQDAFQLIMMPGFSTAAKISNISGRGVGLDVVKTMINNLKGTITVNSAKGKGTSFVIKLPLTLAIIQGLLVRVGSEVYSIPIANVIESQCVNIKDINHIDNYEVMNVRNEVITVLRLARLFGMPEAEQKEECYIVIVGNQDKKIGVMVDALVGEEDVVIKPLKDQFTNSPGIAGASILGDGSVSLIIDVSALLDLGVKQEQMAQEQSA
ncbi:MAG: chemotaxis protein CheA [Treponema sp.]|nr:chemotaxis protein CheA [Treponema sp.]